MQQLAKANTAVVWRKVYPALVLPPMTESAKIARILWDRLILFCGLFFPLFCLSLTIAFSSFSSLLLLRRAPHHTSQTKRMPGLVGEAERKTIGLEIRQKRSIYRCCSDSGGLPCSDVSAHELSRQQSTSFRGQATTEYIRRLR